MTVHKAQGQTLGRVIVDLAGCIGMEQPYVMVSRVTFLQGLVVLRDFDAWQIAKRRSEELRKEFTRLTTLRWQTITRFGVGPEVTEAKGMLREQRASTMTRGIKRKSVEKGKGSAAKRARTWESKRVLDPP